MAKKKNLRTQGDATKPFDAVEAACPECGGPVHMYVPPERTVGGPIAYPALLIHYENAHAAYVAGSPRGWSTPPPPPVEDDWETQPPKPADWVPIDRRAAEMNAPQDSGVWPPVHAVTRP